MGDSLAWVTLATNDSYSLGALVLAHSLKQVGTKQQLAVLITPGVTGAMRSKLQEVFNLVQEVNLLDSRDEANLRLLKRPELGITFTKLHCWRLTQFNKCVFLDADTLVLENCDELFEREELSAAPDIGWPDCFNSGVFVYRPSNETYEKLIQLALEKGSFDGGDQGLLNLYFSDWAHKDISKHLPFIYNMASTACYSYLPAFKQFGQNAKIIHFIGSAKPWLQYFDTETKQVHPAQDIQHLREILQRWWNIFCSCIHPNLSSEMSVRSHTDTVHGSQPHIPNNPHPNPLDHYHNFQFYPNPSAPNPAVNYQNVWDPWEEYDSKQLQPSAEIVDTYHIHEHFDNPSNQHSYETPKTDNYPNRSEQIEQHDPPQSYHHNTEIRSNDDCNPPSHNSNPPNYNHNNFGHVPNPSSHHIDDPPNSNPTQNVHSNYQKRDQEIQLFHSETSRETVKNHIQNRENQLLESHNTTAYSDADKNTTNVPPHTPINSQPHPVVHNDTPKNPSHELYQLSTQSPTIPDFRLPNESITTTVSDEITLQTDSNEDSNDNAGIAGAFAKLTLGTPRTAEQLALDDHLRRQGWEIGNIDYLGRDSFENIWSKICETLSSGPETPQSVEKVQSEPVIQKESSVLDSTPPQQIEPTKPEVQLTESKKTETIGNVIETSTAETVKPQIDVSKSETTSVESIKPSEVPQSANLPQSSTELPAPATESPKPTEEAPKSVSESPKLEPTSEITQVVAPTVESPKTEAITVQPQAKTDISQLPSTESLKSVTETAPVAETVPTSSEAPKSTPESISVSSESVPKVTESPKPTVEAPKPLIESPKPDAKTPESKIPASEAPKAVTESPKQVTASAKPETEAPKPLVETPKPASESPKTVAETPKVEAPPPASASVAESPKIEAPPAVASKGAAESPKVEVPTTVASTGAAESPKVEAPTPAANKGAAESPKVETPPAVASKGAAESPKVEAPPAVASKGAAEIPKVETPPPVASKGAPESPKVETPPAVASKSAAESPKVQTPPAVTSKGAPESPKVETPPAVASKGAAESPKVETPPPVPNVAESPKSETKVSPPQAAKPTAAGEQKGKKSKEASKAEPTSPTSPGSSQSKQTKALGVEVPVPDTPPPAESSVGPTPPPRKGGADKKKTGTKAKK